MSETKIPVAYENVDGRVLPYTATLAKHEKKMKLKPIFTDSALTKAQEKEAKPVANRRAKVEAADK